MKPEPATPERGSIYAPVLVVLSLSLAIAAGARVVGQATGETYQGQAQALARIGEDAPRGHIDEARAGAAERSASWYVDAWSGVADALGRIVAELGIKSAAAAEPDLTRQPTTFQEAVGAARRAHQELLPFIKERYPHLHAQFLQRDPHRDDFYSQGVYVWELFKPTQWRYDYGVTDTYTSIEINFRDARAWKSAQEHLYAMSSQLDRFTRGDRKILEGRVPKRKPRPSNPSASRFAFERALESVKEEVEEGSPFSMHLIEGDRAPGCRKRWSGCSYSVLLEKNGRDVITMVFDQRDRDRKWHTEEEFQEQLRDNFERWTSRYQEP